MARIEVAGSHKGITPPYQVIQVKENEIFIRPTEKAELYTLKVGDCITLVEHTADNSVDPTKYYDVTHSGIIEAFHPDYIVFLANTRRFLMGITERGVHDQQQSTDWSTIQKRSCYTSNTRKEPLGDMPFRNAGGKRRRRTRQARRRKNRRTRSRK